MVYQEAQLDLVFGALADPTRRGILASLASRERTISELAAGYDMSLPAVSKHIRVLERAGLARVRREGRARRTQLVARPMRDAAAWIDKYRMFWEHQFDLLAAYLEHPRSIPSPANAADEPPCPPPEPNKPRRRRSTSKSAARSRPRASESSTRGRRRPSSDGGTRRTKE